jgi:hypothetical protein
MQMRRELRPVSFLTAQNPVFKQSFLQGILNEVGNKLEMVARLIGHPAFRMASIVTAEAIATAAPRERMKKSFAFIKFAQTQIEQAGAMAIHQHHAQDGKRSQQVCQRFQAKMPVNQKLGAVQLCRQIIGSPKTLRGAGEDCLGVRTVAPKIVR